MKNKCKSFIHLHRLIIISVLVVVICLAAIVTLVSLRSQTNAMPVVKPSQNDTVLNLAKVPKWEERSLPSKYVSAEIDGQRFVATGTTVATTRLADSLGNITLVGYDEADINFYIENSKIKEYRLDAAVYALHDLDPQCVVAIKYDGQESFYVYVAEDYKPETLGEFMTKLNPQASLQIGEISYDKANKTYTYELKDIITFWNFLKANSAAKYVNPNELNKFGGEWGVHVYSDLTEDQNLYFGISHDGYLFTNIYHTVKAFDIGTDASAEFIENIIK
ncbi:MAG: hypothetical protein GX907_04595 [Clostridiaceae bacterium]|nr:hypothetical protein [Clostridiaceae bacterium]